VSETNERGRGTEGETRRGEGRGGGRKRNGHKGAVTWASSPKVKGSCKLGYPGKRIEIQSKMVQYIVIAKKYVVVLVDEGFKIKISSSSLLRSNILQDK
jgi:hypothetical protein